VIGEITLGTMEERPLWISVGMISVQEWTASDAVRWEDQMTVKALSVDEARSRR
jgi:hypothetical protein